jgi:hypothetical protein
MNSCAWRNIISTLITCVFIPAFCGAQEMTRLAMEYRLFTSANEAEKNHLRFSIADQHLNNGNWEEALRLIETTNAGKRDTAFKFFLLGKAMFASDDYRQAAGYFNRVNDTDTSNDFLPEMILLKCVSYNHLLNQDSTCSVLGRHLALKGIDTTGLAAEIHSFQIPRQYDLRKASRKSSLIPGAGLFYVDERRKAFTSLFLNLAFAGYTAYSIYTRYYFTAALTGVAQWMRFYSGGRRAAVKLGAAKNEAVLAGYFLDIDRYCENKLLGL